MSRNFPNARRSRLTDGRFLGDDIYEGRIKKIIIFGLLLSAGEGYHRSVNFFTVPAVRMVSFPPIGAEAVFDHQLVF